MLRVSRPHDRQAGLTAECQFPPPENDLKTLANRGFALQIDPPSQTIQRRAWLVQRRIVVSAAGENRPSGFEFLAS
jgi:hypothetical protein